MDDEETQAIADARETRDLVLAVTLKLAVEVIYKVDADERLDFAAVAEEYDAGGFTWKLSARYQTGASFVRITGNPEVTDRVMVSHEEMARIMGNQTAAFDTIVPREWVKLADVGASESSFLSAPPQ